MIFNLYMPSGGAVTPEPELTPAEIKFKELEDEGVFDIATNPSNMEMILGAIFLSLFRSDIYNTVGFYDGYLNPTSPTYSRTSDDDVNMIILQVYTIWENYMGGFESPNIKISSISLQPDTFMINPYQIVFQMEVIINIASEWDGNIDKEYKLLTDMNLFTPDSVASMPFGVYTTVSDSQLLQVKSSIYPSISAVIYNNSNNFANINIQKLKDATKQALKFLYGEVEIA